MDKVYLLIALDDDSMEPVGVHRTLEGAKASIEKRLVAYLKEGLLTEEEVDEARSYYDIEEWFLEG